MSKKQNFEYSLSELQSIIEELESENLSLENMVKLFESGMKLMKICMFETQNLKKLRRRRGSYRRFMAVTAVTLFAHIKKSK